MKIILHFAIDISNISRKASKLLFYFVGGPHFHKLCCLSSTGFRSTPKDITAGRDNGYKQQGYSQQEKTKKIGQISPVRHNS